MDSSFYRDLTTTRGLKYHYYFSAAHDSKPTLLFLHGFPSTSFDWRKQVPFFKERGFGLIVPDLLGYGGTDKPTDVKDYKYSAMSADMIDIMNAENVEKVVAIGHDWGSFLAARLAAYYPERFAGFAFLTVAYSLPQPDFNLSQVLQDTKRAFGYELFGYWLCFAEEGSEKLIEEHLESALSILFPADPSIWATHLAPTGTLKSWISSDQKTDFAPYITGEEIEEYVNIARTNGFTAPVNWYKVMVSGVGPEDDKNAPSENAIIRKPVFYGACKQDHVALASIGVQRTTEQCPNATIKQYDSDHWLQLSHADEFNNDFLAWLENIVSAPIASTDS